MLEPELIQISLRAARITSGYTVEEAARHIKVSPETLCAFEQDAGDMPLSMAIEILNLYRVPVDVVYFGRESELNVKRDRS